MGRPRQAGQAADAESRRGVEVEPPESEQRFRQLAESLPQLVWTCRADGPCDYLGPQWLEYTGIPEAEQLGSGWMQQLHPDDRAPTIAAWNAAVGSSAAFDVEFRIRRHDGVYRWFKTRALLLRDAQGQVVKWFGTSADIDDLRRAEETLRESEERFRTFFESAPFGKCMTAPDGRLTEVNPALAAMLGYSREELAALSFADITHRDDLPESRECVRRLLAGERETWSMEKRYRTKDGRWLWTQVTTRLLRDPHGQPRHFLTHVQDISERRQAEEAQSRFAALGELVQVLDLASLLVCDLDDRVIHWNTGCQRLYGITAEEALGHALHELLRTRFPESPEKMRATLLASGRWAGEVVQTAADGRELAVASEWVLQRDAEGRPTAILKAHTDITERKRAEDEIRRLNAELEQRVIDRTAQLAAANRELETFSYSVSHDLRAPLRHISGFSELLARRSAEALDETGRHYLETITASVQQMGVLIDDLLQFSRSASAELKFAAVDMNATLAEALEPLRREADDRDIEWSIGPLPRVVGDPALLRQVWANLVGNSVKFTRGRAPAHIEVGARDGDGAREDVFFVRDNGAGFDMQYAHKLFGVFQRLHSAADFEGTGIGLANVQRIILRLGGRVWAEGEVDHGATFYFALPRRKETPS